MKATTMESPNNFSSLSDSPHSELCSFPHDVPTKFLNNSSAAETEIRLGLHTKEDFVKWLKDYQKKSGYTFRVLRHRRSCGNKVKFRATYRCHHNTVPLYHNTKKPSEKHTACPCLMEVTIKVVHSHNRSKDNYLLSHPTYIRIKGKHNHRNNTVESLKCKDVSEEVRTKFMELFKAGNGPAHSLELHKKDLMEKYDEKYNLVTSDRSICPDIKWVRNFFYGEFKKLYGDHYGGKKMENLLNEVNNLKAQGFNIAMGTIEEHFYISICTPVMERIHSLSSSAEICFINSSSNVYRQNCKVFLILVNSAIGGLPVGCLITSCESEEILLNAMRNYVDILPSNAFGGRGKLGPNIFLTSGSHSEKKCLNVCFPEARQLLCTVHILQNSWQWLWDSKHIINKFDRKELYTFISQMIYSRSEVELHRNYNLAKESCTSQKYSQYVKYISELHNKYKMWAHCFRMNHISQENSCSNLAECAIYVLNDKILWKTRSLGVIDLLHFVLYEVQNYYERKIIHAINGRLEQFNLSRYKLYIEEAEYLDAVKEENHLYRFKSAQGTDFYLVAMDIGLCECFAGRNGGPCKHQYAAAALKDAPTNTLPSDSLKEFFWVATGKDSVSNGFICSLIYKNSSKEHCLSRRENLSDKNSTESTVQKNGALNHSTLQIGEFNHELNIQNLSELETVSAVNSIQNTVHNSKSSQSESLNTTETEENKQACASIGGNTFHKTYSRKPEVNCLLSQFVDDVLKHCDHNPNGVLNAVKQFHVSYKKSSLPESGVASFLNTSAKKTNDSFKISRKLPTIITLQPASAVKK